MAAINSGTPEEVAYVLYKELEPIEFKDNIGQKAQNVQEALDLFRKCVESARSS